MIPREITTNYISSYKYGTRTATRGDLFISLKGLLSWSQRSEINLQIPLLRTSMGQNAFCYCGAKLWNELSREAKLASSLTLLRSPSNSCILSFI